MTPLAVWIARIKKFKALGWVFLAGVVVVMTIVVRRLFTSPTDDEWKIPPVPTALQNQVEQAQENAQVADAQAKATQAAQQAQLTQILAVSNAVTRRQQLATFLQGLN